MSEIKYDPSGKLNSSFQVGADIFKFFVVAGRFNIPPLVINTYIDESNVSFACVLKINLINKFISLLN